MLFKQINYKVVSEWVATATALGRFQHHHALKYRTSIATPLATVVANAVAANSDTASSDDKK